jgi:hypothetical protein
MCGPSSQEQTISNEQQAFYQQLTNQYQTIFGQNQAITGALTSAFTPILQAGPGQTGMTASEEQALRTQADTGVATNYQQAQQAAMRSMAAAGGGNTFLPSSITANITAANANAAALARSNAQLGITQQNYALGRENWLQAANVLGTTAGLSSMNPLGYAGAGNTAGQNAFSSASTMAQQSWSPWSAALGTLGSVAGQGFGAAAINKWG